MILLIEDIKLVYNGIELLTRILCGEMKLEKVNDGRIYLDQT